MTENKLVSDATNRLYVRTNKYPHGGLITGKEVDRWVKKNLVPRDDISRAAVECFLLGRIYGEYHVKGQITREHVEALNCAEVSNAQVDKLKIIIGKKDASKVDNLYVRKN